MQAWTDVALLEKAQTTIGGFVVRCTADPFLLLAPGDELAFVPPRIDCPRRARIRSIERVEGLCAQIRFDGFETMQQTVELVGAHCLAPRAGLSREALAASGLLFEGFTVVDTALGILGEAEGVLQGPAQDLLAVRRADRERSGNDSDEPLLIPLVEAFIRDIDEEQQRIEVDIPAGLLEL